MRSITASCLIAAPPLDLYNPADAARSLASTIPGAQWLEIPSERGHQSATASDPDAATLLNRQAQAWLGD